MPEKIIPEKIIPEKIIPNNKSKVIKINNYK